MAVLMYKGAYDSSLSEIYLYTHVKFSEVGFILNIKSIVVRFYYLIIDLFCILCQQVHLIYTHMYHLQSWPLYYVCKPFGM